MVADCSARSWLPAQVHEMTSVKDTAAKDLRIETEVSSETPDDVPQLRLDRVRLFQGRTWS